jgi:ATP-binding cassette subfamily C protein
MTEIQDLIGSLDSPISVEGNRKLILDNDACGWIVTEGTVHVFASKLTEEGDSGRRHYVSQFNKGDMIFGTAPYTENDTVTAFLCTGVTDTKLAKINLADLQEALADEEKASLACKLVRKWVLALSESTIDLLSREEWIQDISPHSGNLLKDLKSFNQAAVKKAALYIEAVYMDEGKRIKSMHINNDSMIEESMKGLVGIFGKRNEKRKVSDNIKDLHKDPFVAVCQIIGWAMGIKVRIPPDSALKTKDPFIEIIRYSQIRCRQTVLAGEWWKTDNGPFAAFSGEDNAPVALIPVTSKKYKVINPEDGSERIVNSEIASAIQPAAYMFYRVFPNKVLNAVDILRFCCHDFIKKDLFLVVLIGLLGGILNLFIPIANGLLFDNIIPSGDRSQLIQMAFLLGSFGLSAVLFQIVRTFSMIRIEGRTDTILQAAVWDRVLSLPATFFRQFTAGELAMRVMGIGRIRQAISGTVMTAILSAAFSLLNITLLVRYSPHMALYAMALVFIGAAVTFACSFLQQRYEKELVRISNQIAGQVLQILGGIAKLRVAGAEKRAFFQWAKVFGEQREIEFKNKTIENALVTFNEVFPLLSSIVLFFAVFSARDLGAGSFIAFNAAFTSFMSAMLGLSGVIPVLNRIVPIYGSIKPIFRTLPEYTEIKEDPGELDGTIELSHITFRYKPDTAPVINDLSLKVNKGEYLAIVGASGSGKSTILRLLLGLEKPELGKIYYSAHDIEKVDIRSIRKQLGVVMQNSQLISGDIKSNIIGSSLNLTMEDAVEAAKMAGIYEDIQAMPMGMFTVISEGGSLFSGGQRQRLMIARALASKPKILFFDEATSALDNKSQSIISDNMEALKTTRVVIAHRLSTIVKCSRIIVLDKGRIIEEGSYEELMENRSSFFELAQRQLA